jgi:GTPase SAR1 family protein
LPIGNGGAHFWSPGWDLINVYTYSEKLYVFGRNISIIRMEPKIVLCPQFVIVVIDSTDRERLAVTREELYRMLAHEELSKAAVLIYANKQDLKGSMSAAEISKQLDLTSIKKHQWQIQSCCALTGEG